MLSEGYQGDEDFISRSEAELQSFSSDIKQGRAIAFDEAEIAAISKMGEELDALPRVGFWRSVLQTLLPLGLILIGVAYLLYIN